MLYSLGPLAFKVAPMNTHGVSYSAETSYAEKAVLGAEPLLEFVGEGSNTWTMDVKLFPKKFDGMSELQMLHQLRQAGLPLPFMRGDGAYLGWVNIKSVSEHHTYIDIDGVGRCIEISISLQRSAKPEAGQFFSIIAGMLG